MVITAYMTRLCQSQPMHTRLLCLDNIQRFNTSKPPLSKVFQHKKLVGSATAMGFPRQVVVIKATRTDEKLREIR